MGGLIIWNIKDEEVTSDAVRDAYIAWKDNLDLTKENALANAVAEALRDWIWEQRQDLPRLQYIVLAGDDRIIAHWRETIRRVGGSNDGWKKEYEYLEEGTTAPVTTVGRALADDRTLTDDVYGAREPVSWQGGELHLPELAVGRLV